MRYATLLHGPEIILSQKSMGSLQVCLWFHEVCGYLFRRRAYWQILLGFMLQRRKTPERDGFGAAWCCGACAPRSHLKTLNRSFMSFFGPARWPVLHAFLGFRLFPPKAGTDLGSPKDIVECSKHAQWCWILSMPTGRLLRLLPRTHGKMPQICFRILSRIDLKPNAASTRSLQEEKNSEVEAERLWWSDACERQVKDS